MFIIVKYVGINDVHIIQIEEGKQYSANTHLKHLNKRIQFPELSSPQIAEHMCLQKQKLQVK